MPTNANTGKRPENSQTREPAKGSLSQPTKIHIFRRQPKPHGDPLRHVIEEQEKK